jgi:hypothetical protein
MRESMVWAPARQRSQPSTEGSRITTRASCFRGAAMSDPRIRAKRILTHEVEFERLAEIATTTTMRAEYQAIAAQYRRLALAEANRADAADSAIRESKRELETHVSIAQGP